SGERTLEQTVQNGQEDTDEKSEWDVSESAKITSSGRKTFKTGAVSRNGGNYLMMPWFFWVFAACYAVHLVWEVSLTLLNDAEMRRNAGMVPDYFKDKIDERRYAKAIAYNLEKSRFGLFTKGYDVVVTFAVILSGF